MKFSNLGRIPSSTITSTTNALIFLRRVLLVDIKTIHKFMTTAMCRKHHIHSSKSQVMILSGLGIELKDFPYSKM